MSLNEKHHVAFCSMTTLTAETSAEEWSLQSKSHVVLPQTLPWMMTLNFAKALPRPGMLPVNLMTLSSLLILRVLVLQNQFARLVDPSSGSSEGLKGV